MENNAFTSLALRGLLIGPLQLLITWYKKRHRAPLTSKKQLSFNFLCFVCPSATVFSPARCFLYHETANITAKGLFSQLVASAEGCLYALKFDKLIPWKYHELHEEAKQDDNTQTN